MTKWLNYENLMLKWKIKMMLCINESLLLMNITANILKIVKEEFY